jgi:hypothetical protein
MELSTTATPDHEFALELAAVSDIFFTDGRPSNPRPTLAALVAKPDLSAALACVARISHRLTREISPADEVTPRAEMISDLVDLVVNGIWEVPEGFCARAIQLVTDLDVDPAGQVFEDNDLVVLSLFVIGLSAFVSKVSESSSPGDPLRELARAA